MTLLATTLLLSVAGTSVGLAKRLDTRSVPMPPEKPLILAENAPNAPAPVQVALQVVSSGISDEDRLYVRRYITTSRNDQNFVEDQRYNVGDETPSGLQYQRIEGRPSVERFRYAQINGRLLLIEPETRRVVEILN